MCDANAIMAAQGFGGGMSTVGAFFGAQAQQDQLRSQARIAEINARIADGNARNIIRAGTIEESRVKMRGSQAKATQIAQIASSGIDLGSTTATARLTGNDVITEEDANMVRANALRAAWGQRFAAGDERRKAASLNSTASSINPLMAGATTLIGAVGQVAASWYSMNKEGAFDPKAKQGEVTLENGILPGDQPTAGLLDNWGFGDWGGAKMPNGMTVARRFPTLGAGVGY